MVTAQEETDDLGGLAGARDRLGWLGDDPAAAVRASIVEILRDQVAGAELDWLRVVEPPRILTNPAGFAVSFTLSVREPAGDRSVLRGALTWAAAGLDEPAARRDRVWFDLGADLDWAERELPARAHSLGRAAR